MADYDSPKWLRGPARLIEDEELGPRIVLDLERAEEYIPTQDPAVVYEVAAIRHPTDVLGVVRRRGLLKLTRPPLPPTHSEPYHWWRNLAQELDRLLRAYQLVQATARGVPGAFEELRAFARGDVSIRNDSHRRHGVTDPPDDDLVYSVSREVARSVSKGILESGGNTVLVALPEDPTRIVMEPMVENLEDLVWHTLARQIVDTVPVRQCAECFSVFPVRDQRQRYCSERCAVRARGRRFRQKKKEGRA